MVEDPGFGGLDVQVVAQLLEGLERALAGACLDKIVEQDVGTVRSISSGCSHTTVPHCLSCLGPSHPPPLPPGGGLWVQDQPKNEIRRVGKGVGSNSHLQTSSFCQQEEDKVQCETCQLLLSTDKSCDSCSARQAIYAAIKHNPKLSPSSAAK